MLKVFAFTHVGGRATQEDALLVMDEVFQEREFSQYIDRLFSSRAVLAVCDGMGGLEKGEVASYWTAKNLKGLLKLKEITEESIRKFLTELQQKALTDKNFPEGGGTTVAGLIVEGENFWVFNAGDSRVYLLKEDTLSLVSEDHSVVWKLYKEGIIEKEALRTHPFRNLIYFGIGRAFQEEWEDGGEKVKVLSGKLTGEELFIITTDGLTDLLEEREILQTVKGGLPTAGEELFKKVKESYNQTTDNVTCIIVEPALARG